MRFVVYIVVIFALSACGSGLCPMRNATGQCARGSGSIFVAPTGTLDATFGISGAGYSYSTLGQSSGGARDVCLQSDGKIIIVGPSTTAANTNYTVARFTAAGVLDTSFGTASGYTWFGTGAYEDPQRCIVLPDDKVVMASMNTGTEDFFVHRFLANGQQDTAFATTGAINIDFFGSTDRPSGLKALSDGSIIISGYATNGTTDFALAKLDSNGALSGFGTVSNDYAGFGDGGGDVVVLPNGSILQSGGVGTSGVNTRTGVVKYDSSGALDTAFGTAGVASTFFAAGSEGASSLALQSDGKIITCGQTQSGAVNFGLARFATDGALDTSFGTAGKINQDFGSGQTDICRNVFIQPDDKIIAVGTATIGGLSYIGVARYTANGALDTSFGTGGLFTSNLSGLWTGAISYFRGIQKPDGKIVLAMGVTIGGTLNFLLVQLK